MPAEALRPVTSLILARIARATSRASGMPDWLAPVMEDFDLPKAAIFDLDGTLLDSVDLHAIAWQEAMLEFGHDVSFEQVRSQIGKGGDKLIPVFLSADEQKDHG